jgi:hypothetical protein
MLRQAQHDICESIRIARKNFIKKLMPTAILKKNAYFDSITLMRVSEQIRKISGVKKAQIVMGTVHNKSLLRDCG